MELGTLAHLIQLDEQLTASKHEIDVSDNGIRQISDEHCLDQCFHRLAIILAMHQQTLQHPMSTHMLKMIVLMVTASHNPPGYNGLKYGAMIENILPKKGFVKEIINNSAKFKQYVQKSVVIKPSKGLSFFVGRDKRYDSAQLSEILINALRMCGSLVIDLGEATTPQIYSLSEFAYKKIDNGETINEFDVNAIRTLYCNEILDSFEKAIELIQKNTIKNEGKLKIYLDFANGVGYTSFKPYMPVLSKYFDLICVNTEDYLHVNVNCGAEHIYFNRSNLSSVKAISDEYDWMIFFDGDSDRIIARPKQSKQIFDGDDFNYVFSLMLHKLAKQVIDSQSKFQQISVGNIVSNNGIKVKLDEKGIQFVKAATGVKKVFEQVSKHDFGCYFQSNGHGCMYFSPHFLQYIQKKSQNPNAKLLLHFHTISRNNPKGYGLHNFLLLYLAILYLNLDPPFWREPFEKHFLISKNYQLTKEQLAVCENGKTGQQLLIKPVDLAQIMIKIQQQHKDMQITLRRSLTTPILRLSIQGKEEKSKAIFEELDKIIMNYW